jgi:hypothetical protein
MDEILRYLAEVLSLNSLRRKMTTAKMIIEEVTPV